MSGLVVKSLALAGLIAVVALAGCVEKKPIAPASPTGDAMNAQSAMAAFRVAPFKYSGSTPQRVCAVTTFACVPPGRSGGSENPHVEAVNGTPQMIGLKVSWAGGGSYMVTVSALSKNESDGQGGGRNGRMLASKTDASPLEMAIQGTNWTKDEGRLSIRVAPTSLAPSPITLISDPGITFDVVGMYLTRA